MSKLSGKVAIITGSGQGVGLGIAKAMAKQGASVVLAGRTEEKVKFAERELKKQSLTAMAVKCDVADHNDIRRTVDAAIERFGGIDIVVNNAACGYDLQTLEETTTEYLQSAINTNVFGTFWLMKAAFSQLKSRRGRVINLASEAGFDGWASLGSYAATKEAVRALSRTAAKEWGPLGINVNVICPLAKSPGMKWFEDNQPDQYKAVLGEVPLGYIGDCEADIGPVAVFLACDDSRYITGQTFMVDGGHAVLR